MSDSEDCEIDVCSIDDATAANMHTGLTLVAAETYISDVKETPALPVPLSASDLLTKSKQRKILQAKLKRMKKNPLTKQDDNIRVVTNTITGAANNNTEVLKDSALPRKAPLRNKAEIKKGLDQSYHKKSSSSKKKMNTVRDNKVEEEMEVTSEDELFDTGVNNMLNQFHFESDHLAIKSNKDYHTLLKTLAVLEAQRVQAIKDLEELQVLRKNALDEPINFVKDLQDKKAPSFPQRQSVAKLPDVNWVHYMTAYGGGKYVPQITTRKSMKSHEVENVLETEFLDDDSMDSITTENPSSMRKTKVDGAHPTFNQKWTVEEQEKLEKLLVLYPPEEVEARRWEKIAKALGNRTPLQVCSRIQKYFLKLAKANLPIPGRMPSTLAVLQKKKTKVNLVSYKNSSFFPSWQPNVMMNEDEDEEDDRIHDFSMINENLEVSDEETVPDIFKDSPEYRELLELKRMKKHILKSGKNNTKGPEMHVGYMCDGCNMDPISGVRWHCNDCPQQQSVDFCNNCAQRSFTNEVHKSSHQLVPVQEITESFLDNDYLSFEQRNRFKYNYLDPNFLPSNKKT